MLELPDVSPETKNYVLDKFPNLKERLSGVEDSALFDKVLNESMLRIVEYLGILDDFSVDEILDLTWNQKLSQISDVFDNNSIDELKNKYSPQLAFDVIMGYHTWQSSEAFGIFSKDYQVKELSRFTRPRWDEFFKLWAEMNLKSRANVLEDYLENDFTEDSDFEIITLLSQSRWIPIEVIPFVRLPEPEIEPERKPQGADGKTAKI